MSFSGYLVGTWEKRGGVLTYLQIINPIINHMPGNAQPENLEILIAFFDANEQLKMCITEKLSPNDMCEIDVSNDERLANLEGDYGVVKIFSYLRNTDSPTGTVVPGIVGYQRRASLVAQPPTAIALAFAESPLAAVQMEFAQVEYDYVYDGCRRLGSI